MASGIQLEAVLGTGIHVPATPEAVVWVPDLESGRFTLLTREPAVPLGAWVEAQEGPTPEGPGLDAVHRQRLLELAREVARDGQPRHYDHDVRLLGGRRAWVRTELQRVTPGPSARAGLLGTSFDLTALKLVETELRHALGRLEAVLDEAPLVLFVVDRAGTLREARGRGLALLGRKPEAFVGRSAAALGEEAPWLEEALRQALAGEETRWSGTLRGRCLEVHSSPLREDGIIAGLISVGLDVTERKQAEDALQRSRDELSAVLQAAPVGITVLVQSGARLYCNAEAARLTGYPDAGALCGAPIGELTTRMLVMGDGPPRPFRPEENPAVRALAGADTPVQDLHYRLVTTGQELHVRLSARAVRDPRGTPLFAVVTWQDISALKRAEEALRLQMSLLEAQSEASTEGVLVVSPEGRILSFNGRFLDMWGLSEEQLSARADTVALDKVQEQLANPGDFQSRVEFLASHPDAKVHDELVLRDGRTLERYSLPLIHPEKPSERYGRAWFFRDITTRKQAEQRERGALLEQTTRTLSDAAAQRASFLADASRLLSASLDSHTIAPALARRCVPYLADWCVVDLVEPDGTVQRAAVAHADPLLDELAQRLMEVVPDLGEEEGIGKVLRSGEPDVRDVEPGWLEASAGEGWAPVGARTPEQLEVVRQLGITSLMTLPLSARGRVLGALTLVRGAGALAYGPLERELAEDLAGRTAMALENALLYLQSQRAVLLRDEFLSIAAHELRTPLTALELAVRSFRRTADRGRADPRQVVHVLSSVQRQAGRLEKLVESLLDVARLQSGKLPLELQSMDLVAVVADVVALLHEEALRYGSPIEVRTTGAVVGVCDRALLEQVVTSLVDNAIKYGGGKPITVNLSRRGSVAVLEVTDRGIGIPEAEQARIFQRFERAVSASHYGGLGLGLYIAGRAVERLGGTISVRSRPGQGATFTVVLPLEGVRAAAPADGARA